MDRVPLPAPSVGDEIYIPSAFYLSRGRDDVVGGLAKVTQVKPDISGGQIAHFVSVAEHPNRSLNWEHYLEEIQDELKNKFGLKRAFPDPDYRREFNEP